MKINEISPCGALEIEINLQNASKEQLYEIAKLTCKNVTILIRNQNLTKKNLIEIYTTLGSAHKRKFFFSDDEYPEICLVTNKRSEKGEKLGVFADLELGWHSNGNTRSNPDQDLIMLYCEKPGLGGDTSFVNTKMAFEELSDEDKKYYETLTSEIRFDVSHKEKFYDLSKDDPEYQVFSGVSEKKRGLDTDYGIAKKPLVCEHRYTKDKALYFCYPLIERLVDDKGDTVDSVVVEKLKAHVFQKRYIYEHKWQPGDVIFNDQVMGLHKRTAVSREVERLLYRLCFNLKHVKW